MSRRKLIEAPAWSPACSASDRRTASQASRPAGTEPLSPDERDFARALEDYKRSSGRMFPTWSEVLEVLLELGYRKEGHRPVAANQAMLVWTHDLDSGSLTARLMAIDAEGAVLASVGLPPSGASARFCLTQPTRTGWVEATVTAVETVAERVYRVRLSGFRGPAIDDILRAITIEHSARGSIPGQRRGCGGALPDIPGSL